MVKLFGFDENLIDKTQQEMLNNCHKIRPYYFPVVEPVIFQGKTVLVVWAPGGTNRPYKAPDQFTNPYMYSYYVRRFSSTKKVNDAEQQDLLTMSARIPFDDQINQRADIQHLKLNLIQSHLKEIGSDLYDRSASMSLSDLTRKMHISEGPDEYLKPKNIGLLLFNDNPAAFFPCAQIDVVEFKNSAGDKFTEKIFRGPIQ